MAWCQNFNNGGLAKWGHAVIHVPDRSSVYILGGYPYRKGDKIEVNVLNTDTSKWRKVPSKRRQTEVIPSDRCYHTTVLHNKKIYLFGGGDALFNIDDNMLWIFSLETEKWSCPARLAAPDARGGHSACVINGYMVVFGGWTRDLEPQNDLLLLNLSTGKWETSIPQNINEVPPRALHTASDIGGLMYIIGGFDGTKKIEREFIQVYDVSRNKWHTPTMTGDIPVPRSGHCAVTLDDKIYICGGRTDFGGSNDLYKYHTGKNQWSQVYITGSLPPPIDDHKCVIVGNDILIIGGYISLTENYNGLAHLRLVLPRTSSTTLHKSKMEGPPIQFSEQKESKYARSLSGSQGTTIEEQVPKLTTSERLIVQCSRKFYLEHYKDSYPISGPTKGAVLVINITEVKCMESGKILTISGSKEDRRCISAMFTDFDYVVEEYEDVNIKQFESALKSFVEQATDIKAWSIFVVLMSHGETRRGNPYIMTSDGSKVLVRETIERHFSSSNVPCLAMIPKVVIVQACLGGNVDTGVNVQWNSGVETDSVHPSGTKKSVRVGEFCNYFYGFATQPRRPAMRSKACESLYITEINDVFRNKAATKHLTELMAEVRKNVSRKYDDDGFIQTPEAIDGLTQTFYLFPGLE